MESISTTTTHAHLDCMFQRRSDRLHQRLLCQDFKHWRLLTDNRGCEMGSGLSHGCCTNTAQLPFTAFCMTTALKSRLRDSSICIKIYWITVTTLKALHMWQNVRFIYISSRTSSQWNQLTSGKHCYIHLSVNLWTQSAKQGLHRRGRRKSPRGAAFEEQLEMHFLGNLTTNINLESVN